MQGQNRTREQSRAQEGASSRRRYTKGPDGKPWIGVRDNADEWRRIMPGRNHAYRNAAFCLANQGDHSGADDPVGHFVKTVCTSATGGPEERDDLVKSLNTYVCPSTCIPRHLGSGCMMAALDASYVTKPDDGYDRLVPLVPLGAADATANACGVSLDRAGDFFDDWKFRTVHGPSGMRSLLGRVRLCAAAEQHDTDTPLGGALHRYCASAQGASGFTRVFVAATGAGYTVDEASCLASRSMAPSS
ncbi:CNP1 incomplete domain containing protein [Pandoravirus neocaledonia]|uniref:CNP1 incomplete domain containing protein n=1 Tax=Pandoravirus neocaledonia TaxID=2107708 RepID=A0A2U7UCT2_9VIRU|nr:CNP1 incomplete domain containing protein [Pandoravirus neocaledonia]AVK76278.1 CNP1 incomplete domain containing protein [Pandoravirus neocaledonia]